MEVDTRLLGMIGALLVIWIGFDLFTDGRFITPRNLFNLSVQTASVAVMACGMVLIIVTRHIDLSVGSVLGVVAMVMGVVQSDLLPEILGYEHPATWIVSLLIGIGVGAAIGCLQGVTVGFLGVPAFIVTLGGYLVWRGAAWWVTQGRTVAPLDSTFQLMGGGIDGTIGATWSWVFAAIAILAILGGTAYGRARRKSFDFPVKPLWAEIVTAGILSALVIAYVATMNAYPIPARAALRIAEEQGLPVPEGGLDIAHGVPIPILIVAAVAIAMTILATRTRFGRYVFAMGGNPEAASLAGINVKRMTAAIFVVMGILCAISAAIASARLQSAANDLGTLDELRVIAAAVIGGCSLAGGVGTIYGALLGALVMQSLQSGMALIGIDTSLQSIIIGIVLVLAVWIDHLYRRRHGAH
ncbi:sugar ABC transporter permease [Rhodospirillaceae bacterium KN72]|uniref:Xylose transport system permease protein XylH n=2 Tax=Pacificispira spongiicola TaxID=2729598 RepID=A0A7Y0DYE5_9PROT|nr:sugar ABC transporter permease [Pacificispira spongiicola]